MTLDPSLVRRVAAMAGIGAIGGALATVVLVSGGAARAPAPTASASASTSAVEIRIAGRRLDPTGDPVATALDLVRQHAKEELRIEAPHGMTRSLRRSELGAEIDRAHLASLVQAALDPTSALRRRHAATSPGAPLELPMPLRPKAEVTLARLSDWKGEVDQPATDAVVDLVNRKLQPERVGFRLDVVGTLARIEAAFAAGSAKVQAVGEVVAPKLRAEQLGHVRFDHVIGWFETRYTQGERTKDRTYNLRLAASKVDGVVVMPGEIFDFNQVVGPRDEAHGYRVAPLIANGELVDGLGGGTCQISGTLHAASLFAGLDIVERSPHSRPSWYIKLGLDAAVVYPHITFRIRNPFPFPVVLHETVANGVVRAEILGPPRTHTVTYYRRIDQVTPFEEVLRDDPKLPEGVKVLRQRGIPGFRTTTSRVVREGAHAVREKWADSYPPTMQIVHVGTGPRELEQRIHDDIHPEYQADQYYVVIQGPDVRSAEATGPEPGGGMSEAREPGNTGTRGWTKKLGMPQYESQGEAPDEAETKPDSKKGDAGKSEGKKKPGAKEDDKPSPKKGDAGKSEGKKKPGSNDQGKKPSGKRKAP
jgi:vancomycin resistance protein YoaR